MAGTRGGGLAARVAALLEEGRDAAALALCDDALLAGASDRERAAAAHAQRGLVFYRQVNFQEAVLDFSRSLELVPDFAEPLFGRGQIHYRLARFRLAMADLRRCLALSPEFPGAAGLLAAAKVEHAQYARRGLDDPLEERHCFASDSVQPMVGLLRRPAAGPAAEDPSGAAGGAATTGGTAPPGGARQPAAADSSGVVLLCHGYLSHKNGAFLRELANALPCASFRFDFLGAGESGGLGEWSFGGYLSEVDQLHCAVRFVTDTLGLQVRAIVGHSRGANVVMLSALDPRFEPVPLLVPVAPRHCMEGGLASRFSAEEWAALEAGGSLTVLDRAKTPHTVTQAGIDQRLAIGAEWEKLRHIGRPAESILLVHGDADPVIPVADAQGFKALLGDTCRVEIVAGAGHSFRQQHTSVLCGVVVGWLTAKGACS